MAAISKTELENASADAQSLSLVTNGADTVTVTTRLGRVYPTIAKWFKDRSGEFTAFISTKNVEFANVLSSANSALSSFNTNAATVLSQNGYAVPVSYGSGINLTTPNQTVSYNGQVYAPIQNQLPFTTSGTFETAKFRLIQGITFSDLSAATGSNLSGYKLNAIGSVVRTLYNATQQIVNLFDFIPSIYHDDIRNGTSTYDATADIIAAVTHVNLFTKADLATNVLRSRCKLEVNSGKYLLSTLAGPILIKASISAAGAVFVVPQSYAGVALQVGEDRPSYNISSAEFILPEIQKPTTIGPLVAGSVGISILNTNACNIVMHRVNHFETAVKMGGIGEGCVYNVIQLPQTLFSKIGVHIKPGSGGWFNSNTVLAGNISQSPSFDGGGIRRAGWFHMILDGRAPGTPIVGNHFIGPAFEGNTSEYLIDAYNAYQNIFSNVYHETGAAGISVTVSSDTLTTVAHGLIVGDLLCFNASVAPIGMTLAVGYYVVAVPTTDTFKVSLNKSGTPITFGSSGTAVVHRLAARVRFNQSGSDLCSDNRLINWFMPPGVLLDVIENGTANNNGQDRPTRIVHRTFSAVDSPIWCGSNFSGTAVSAPIFAAYPAGVDPESNPNFWTTGLGAQGVLFSEGGVYTGKFFNAGGILQYRRPADATNFEIASSRRSPSAIGITALNCIANANTAVDITLTGAAVNDHVIVTPLAALPQGISFSHAFVVSANTIRCLFTNYSSGAISLSTNVNAMIHRRFY